MVENGEPVEPQGLQEGEIFDPNDFLAELTQHYRMENKSQTKPRPPYLSGILFHPMSHPPEVTPRSFTPTPDTPATRYRRKKLTPSTVLGRISSVQSKIALVAVVWTTQSITQSLPNVNSSAYLAKPMHTMKCYFQRPLIMSMSCSERDPGRLFLKFTTRWCDFFQWVDQEPQSRTRTWLWEDGFLSKCDGYPRPQELFQPLMKRPVETPFEGNWIRVKQDQGEEEFKQEIPKYAYKPSRSETE